MCDILLTDFGGFAKVQKAVALRIGAEIYSKEGFEQIVISWYSSCMGDLRVKCKQAKPVAYEILCDTGLNS